jgi:hypothetical protein
MRKIFSRNGFDIDQAYEQTSKELDFGLSIVPYLNKILDGPDALSAIVVNKTQLLIKNLQKQIDDYLRM